MRDHKSQIYKPGWNIISAFISFLLYLTCMELQLYTIQLYPYKLLIYLILRIVGCFAKRLIERLSSHLTEKLTKTKMKKVKKVLHYLLLVWDKRNWEWNLIIFLFETSFKILDLFIFCFIFSFSLRPLLHFTLQFHEISLDLIIFIIYLRQN